MRRAHPTAGFTMIELIVVSVMMVILGAALFTVFRTGINVYRVLEKDRRTGLAFEMSKAKIRQDLNRSMEFLPIPFLGESDTFSFPARVLRPGQTVPRPGRVTYRFDGSGNLLRYVQSYSEVAAERDPTRGELLLSGIESYRVRYLSYDPLSEDFQWETQWDLTDEMEEEDQKKFPVSVTIDIEIAQKKQKINHRIEHAFQFARPILLEMPHQEPGGV